MSDSTFERVELGDIAERSDGSFVDGPFGSSLKSDEYTEEGVRLIQLQNIGISEWFDANQKFISERKFLSLQRHGAVPGDIAIAKMAEPVARACIVPPVSEQFVVVADCIRLRPDTSRFVPSYIAKAINSPYTRHEAEKKAIGSTRVRINLTTLKTVGCLVPTFERQSKIAEVLDTLDVAIRGTEAVVAKLKAMKQGLLHDLLTRGIDANGDLRPPHAEAPHLYKGTPLGWLPKEWDVDHLETFATVHGGKRLPAGHAYADGRTGYKYLRVTDFFGKGFQVSDLENLAERTFKALERYEITAGQLYISIAGSLGHVGVFPESSGGNVRTILTENAARIVLTKEGCSDFFSMMMNSQAVQQQVEWEKGTGGGVPKLALFRIAQFFVGFPDPEEQTLITQAFRRISRREEEETALLDKLRLQKSGLMDDLLTGRVSVAPLLEERAAHGA